MNLIHEVEKEIFESGSASTHNLYLYVDEFARIRKEYEEYKAVTRDLLEEGNAKQLVDSLENEIKRLQDVVLNLRTMLDWDTQRAEYRYTSLME